MYTKILGSLVLFTFLLSSALSAQWKLRDRKGEDKKYPSLQKTGKYWDKDIQLAYAQLSQFGFIVELAKNDRATAILAEKEPHSPHYSERDLKFVPWRSSIRYVKEGEQFLLKSFGKLSKVKELISKSIKLASQSNVVVPNPSFGDREGVEISQFGFIYKKDPDKTRAIGFQRKWINIFFSQASQNQISLATLRVEYNNFRLGVKEIDLIIDPSPMDGQMRDIVILHRYNETDPKVYLLALMYNDKGANHRNQFKAKYSHYLRGDFLQIFKRIGAYNKLNYSASHEGYLKRLNRSLGN